VSQADTTGAELSDRLPVSHPALGPWWIGVWGGAARDSEFDTRLGSSRRDFYLAGIRAGRRLSASPYLALDYFIGVVPFLRSTNNPIEYRERTCESQGEMPMICGDPIMETATAHGYAVSPLGFQVRTLAGMPVQLVIGASAGVAWYDTPVPDPEEKRVNFMGELTVGLQVHAGRSSAILAGIGHNHTSNAGTGRVNPGLDTRVVYAGFTRTLGNRAQR
jgi:hypothetical protein